MVNPLKISTKEYLLLLLLFLFGAVILMVGLEMVNAPVEQESPVPFVKGSEDTEAWCDQMLDKPNRSWSESEILSFSEFCLLD